MTTETVLAPSQIDDVAGQIYGTMANHQETQFARAIEQAVLQSPEVQRLREDAERYQELVRAWLKGEHDADFILMNNPPPDAYESKEDIDSAIDAAMEKQP